MVLDWMFIGKISSFVSIMVAIPVFWSWSILLGQKRRQQRMLQSLEKVTGDNPVAVIVDISPEEIENQVKLYLSKNSMHMDVLKVKKKILGKDTVQDFVEELIKVKAQAMEKGADRFHLFYRGPVVGAIIVGGIFGNTVTTIYHLDKIVGYESWGPLHRTYLQGM